MNALIIETEAKVCQWAHERKIIDFDNWRQFYLQVLKTQTLKLAEEIGELNAAIWQIRELKSGRVELEDAIGDSLVVLTSLAWAVGNNTTIADLLANASADTKDYNNVVLLLGSELGRLSATIIKNKPLEEVRICLARIVLFLYHIADSYGLDAAEAYAKAYEVIKNRRGKTTVDGNFIKEGD